MSAVLVIAGVTVVSFIFSILAFPQIRIGADRRVKIYPFIPLIGGILMLIFGNLPIRTVLNAFLENSSVNPIRILILFFSMTVFSLILDQTGFFEHISGVILQKSGHNQYRIFLSLYAVISLLTVFTSNDIVILTFTPFICHFCKSARIDPVPYLVMEFVAANTWSLFLLIGNPTNIYISGAFEIGFAEYVRTMALPTVAAGMMALVVMSLLFRKKLHGSIRTAISVEPVHNRPLMWVSLLHLVACVALLSVAQYLRVEMWMISLVMAISAVLSSSVCLLIQRRGLKSVGTAIARMPYEIVPFIIGMFVIVLALDLCGFTGFVASLLEYDGSVFSFGFFSFLCCNVLNNIPMSVFFSKILSFDASMGQVYATIVGSNLGAFITPVGALAGIMWLNLLKQNKIKLSAAKFVAFGSAIGVPTMAFALIVLELLI